MQIFNISITITFFLLFYVMLELTYRKLKNDTEIFRKIAHVLSGTFAIIFSYLLNKQEFIFTTLIFGLFFLYSHKTKLLKSISGVQRTTYGELAYPLALILLAAYFYESKHIFIPGILVLAVSDTVASFIGNEFHKKSKSLVGSSGFFLSSLLIFLYFFNPAHSILLALILTMVEFISPFGLDNITIPLLYVILIFFLNT